MDSPDFTLRAVYFIGENHGYEVQGNGVPFIQKKGEMMHVFSSSSNRRRPSSAQKVKLEEI